METLGWAGWLLALIATAIAIRATVRFDLNDWLKTRRSNEKERLKNLCPHVYPSYDTGRPSVTTRFVSPFGTTRWQCEQCGIVVLTEKFVDANTEYWARNPDKLVKRIDKFSRLAKKLGYID